MKSEAPEISELRREMIKILQFMNKYSLREFEYSAKDSPESIHLTRADNDASSPLLEGKSVEVPGQVFAPDVGFLNWQTEENSRVRAGEVIGILKKQKEKIEITAPCEGIVDYLTELDKVEFGELIAAISSPAEDEEQ